MPLRLVSRGFGSTASSARVFEAASSAASSMATRGCGLSELRPLDVAQLLGGRDGGAVSLLMEGSLQFVRSLASCLTSQRPCTAVPLHAQHPLPELLHAVRDSNSCALLAHGTQDLMEKAALLASEAGVPLCPVDSLAALPTSRDGPERDILPRWKPDREPAYIVYTSGTTGRPKGAVVTHGNARARCSAVARAWRLGPSDVVLNCLPLHHVHGLENCLLAPLHAGASVILSAGFQAQQVWQQLAGSGPLPPVTVFMAVPTVYSKLLAFIRQRPDLQPAVREACETRVRLMVSGSAPLPEPVMQAWHQATGHWLLERYGMTEVGMALGNPLEGPRLPGFVGRPFPGMRARIRDPDTGRLLLLADENQAVSLLDEEGGGDGAESGSPPAESPAGQAVTEDSLDEVSGSLELSGPQVFSEYFNRPADTAKEFTEDGWFRTGDTAAFSWARRSFRLQGRTSIDIVKSGGFKISALEVEAVCLGHPGIAECAVVGLSDQVWGERLAVFAVPAAGSGCPELPDLQDWAGRSLAKYKLPRELRVLDSLPRNAMGKVDKAQLKRLAAA